MEFFIVKPILNLTVKNLKKKKKGKEKKRKEKKTKISNKRNIYNLDFFIFFFNTVFFHIYS